MSGSDSDSTGRNDTGRRHFDMKPPKTEAEPVRLGRRTVLKGGAAVAGLAVGSGAVRGFPTIWAQNIKDITLRQFGTGVSAYNDIAVKAKEALGFTVEVAALDSDAVVQRAVTQPKSYDLVDAEFWMLPKIVPTGNLQPMDITKIKLFDKIVPIFTRGEMPDGKKVSTQGTAPLKVSYLASKDSKVFSKQPTQWFNLLPTIYNADTLGIRPDLISEPVTQWKQLLDPKYKGKASILNISSIGIMDAAMICESMGVMKYGDKGNMTKAEIDKTMGVLTEAKKAGQFRAFWKSFDESINLMASGEVVIQSMWSPAVAAVRAKGIPCTYAPLKEGYRAWAGGLGLARSLTGMQLDAAYDYLNWYLSGWTGGFLNRQGYYSALLETAKEYMTADEWGFWMEGKPAQGDILDPFGKVMEKAGAKRDGGSFEQRLGAVACWNSVMDENRYMVQKWNEFIAA
jgi:putative spermidine/putrescine transport system substrate-binding protein